MVRKKSPKNSGRERGRWGEGQLLKLLEPVKQRVGILQKSLRHAPARKLQDAFTAILAGAHGLSEINTRVKSDEVLLSRALIREEIAVT